MSARDYIPIDREVRKDENQEGVTGEGRVTLDRRAKKEMM